MEYNRKELDMFVDTFYANNLKLTLSETVLRSIFVVEYWAPGSLPCILYESFSAHPYPVRGGEYSMLLRV